MSDVDSYGPLNSPLKVNPVFPLFEKCVRKVYNTFYNKVKTDPEAKIEIIFGSDFFDEEYAEFSEITDNDTEKLEQFKKTLHRGLSCQIRSFGLITPVKGGMYCNVCRSQGCPNCAPYQATNRLNYIDCMIRYAIYTDLESAKAKMNEIKNLIVEKGWVWLTVTLTPFHTGNCMLRIGNLMSQFDNPLVEEGQEVRDSIKTFDDLYNFDTVTKIQGDGIEITYLTSTGISFTSTQLYQMRNAGRVGAGIREMGTPKGFHFNPETKTIDYMTIEQKKEKEKEEAGIVETKNVPGVAIDSAPKEVFRETLIKTGREVSLHRRYFVTHKDTKRGMGTQSVKIMDIWLDNLAEEGYPQPRHFNASNITQEDYDEFMKNAIDPIDMPDNILEMEIEIPKNDGTLSHWMRFARTSALLRAQNHMKTAPTIEEWADTILKTLYDTLE